MFILNLVILIILVIKRLILQIKCYIKSKKQRLILFYLMIPVIMIDIKAIQDIFTRSNIHSNLDKFDIPCLSLTYSIILVCNILFNSFVTHIMSSLGSWFIITILASLTRAFNKLNSTFSGKLNVRQKMILANVKKLEIEHQRYTHCCIQVENLLSKPIFFLFMFLIVEMNRNFYLFLKIVNISTDSLNFQYLFNLFYRLFRFAHYFFLFSFTSYSMCSLSQSSGEAYSCLHRISLHLSENEDDIKLAQLIISFKFHLKQSTIRFTC